MKTYLFIIQIILSIAVMALVLLQAKGSGLSGVFGGDGGVYKTRRGIERTLFNVTIGVSIAFFTISVISVLVNR
ncbi:MAG: preprotein translocase subunit SecG [Anaerolineae bacterium]|uniref:preprotein translocase subunit SecG n=1 Tax=Candidatus Amarolinea dominans TaxID=3140696 RepID=UPI003135BD78|nr:preprotein translocase subunit SecG [Anaerolineae bacterium]MBK9091703.1 preprotein translocase subunit SecG [Anaerolineae bacterium]MBK9233537.1 preprotein translocase subunit SecG [Anaerolineae bacterium]